MKMESPLDVLSRAVSMVQSEDKPEKSSGRGTDNDEREISETSSRTLSAPSSPTRDFSHQLNTHSNMECLSPKASSPKRSLPSLMSIAKKIKLENSLQCDSSRKCFDLPPYANNWFQTGKEHHLGTEAKDRKAISPPPLITFGEKPKYIVSLPTRGSFLSRPSVISTSAPTTKYTDKCSISNCNCAEVNCSTKYTPMTKNVIPNGFELPTVEDHFRKSLGDRYEHSKPNNINERPSSVDEHFAKALGKTWYHMAYGQCKSA